MYFEVDDLYQNSYLLEALGTFYLWQVISHWYCLISIICFCLTEHPVPNINYPGLIWLSSAVSVTNEGTPYLFATLAVLYFLQIPFL